ncbi:MAG: hypothetical protein FWF35_00685 [Elusimicrobia bacterium]|nr:hypothetical protein [Elusimicrobiota bacterium]
MKKILVLAAAAFVVAACAASGTNIEMLSKSTVGGMTTNDVAAYYRDSNQKLLDQLVFDNGSQNYDNYVNVFNNMDGDLTAMSTVKTSKDDYYQKLKTVVNKYRAQIKQLK